MNPQNIFLRLKEVKALNYILYILGTTVLLSSCITSKAALKLSNSYEYKVKKIHMEQPNSSYDLLIADYYESLKSPDEKAAEAFMRDTMAFMQKTACLARCPVYRLTLYNNGNAKYEGVENVELTGIYQSKLEPEQTIKLKELLAKVKFLSLPKTFPRAIKIDADSQVTKMVLSDGTFKFPFTINYGEPQEITNIQLYLDQLISEIAWVQI